MKDGGLQHRGGSPQRQIWASQEGGSGVVGEATNFMLPKNPLMHRCQDFELLIVGKLLWIILLKTSWKFLFTEYQRISSASVGLTTMLWSVQVAALRKDLVAPIMPSQGVSEKRSVFLFHTFIHKNNTWDCKRTSPNFSEVRIRIFHPLILIKFLNAGWGGVGISFIRRFLANLQGIFTNRRENWWWDCR
jgi:hypothetical protein